MVISSTSGLEAWKETHGTYTWFVFHQLGFSRGSVDSIPLPVTEINMK